MNDGLREGAEPLSGIFAVDKPSGTVSMKVLETLKPLFSSSTLFATSSEEPPRKKRRFSKGRARGADRVKLGQGGTLDPLASGVLVIGVNKGTKALQSYLSGDKHYRALGVLGLATDSLDAEGSMVYEAPWEQVTKEELEKALQAFRGDIQQIPPAYSAVQVDGMRLYDYARSGKPLPRPVDARICHVSSLELEALYAPDEMSYMVPAGYLTGDKLRVHQDLIGMLGQTIPANGTLASDDTLKTGRAVFALNMSVSGGTYVRTLVDDLARSLGSAAFLAKLERTKQGRFELKDCVSWEILEEAARRLEKGEEPGSQWESAVLDKFQSTTVP